MTAQFRDTVFGEENTVGQRAGNGRIRLFTESSAIEDVRSKTNQERPVDRQLSEMCGESRRDVPCGMRLAARMEVMDVKSSSPRGLRPSRIHSWTLTNCCCLRIPETLRLCIATKEGGLTEPRLKSATPPGRPMSASRRLICTWRWRIRGLEICLGRDRVTRVPLAFSNSTIASEPAAVGRIPHPSTVHTRR